MSQETGNGHEDITVHAAQETGDRDNDLVTDSNFRDLREQFSRCAACQRGTRAVINWPCSCFAHCQACAQRLENCVLCGTQVTAISWPTIVGFSFRR